MKKSVKGWLIAMCSIVVMQLGIYIWFMQNAEQRVTTFVISLLIAIITCIYCQYKANRQYNIVD